MFERAILKDLRQLFELTDDVKQLLPMLFLYCNVQRSPGRRGN